MYSEIYTTQGKGCPTIHGTLSTKAYNSTDSDHDILSSTRRYSFKIHLLRILLFRNEPEIISNNQGHHRMRRDPNVICAKSSIKPQHTLFFGNLAKTIDHAFVW